MHKDKQTMHKDKQTMAAAAVATVAAALLALSGCTAGQAPPAPEEGSSGKADDLRGVAVNLERPEDPIRLKRTGNLASRRRVGAELISHVPDRSVTFEVEDLRVVVGAFEESDERSFLVDLAVDPDDETFDSGFADTGEDTAALYAFKLEMRESEDEAWEIVSPVEGAAQPFYWTRFTMLGTGEVIGTAMRPEDTWGGLGADRNELIRSYTREPFEQGTEFRISVVPTWHIWKFGEMRFETTLHYDLPE